MSRASKIERPRGTHDVLPAEQPLWRRVTSEIERLCALYGYRPISTPVFEDTALFERTSGSGSDVVQKEMYTFSDRSDRSLTLRPEGTAPICRAYVEHGMQREPQPAKLFTIASMYRYGAPGKGRYREHWQASVEAIGSDDPSVDAELIQLYDTLLGRARRLAVRPRAQLHRLPRVPARVSRGAARVARRECRPPRRGHPREGCDEPSPRLRQPPGEARRRSCGARRGPEDRRVAVRRVRRALRRRAARPRRGRRRVHARADARTRARLLLAHDLGVRRPARERERDPLGRRPLRLPRRGDRRARRRPASASAPGSSAFFSRWRPRASRRISLPRSTSSSRSTKGRRESSSRAGSPNSEGRVSPPTPTMRTVR